MTLTWEAPVPIPDQKYRKKPVEIVAWQFTPEYVGKPLWLIDAINDGRVWMQGGADPYFTIRTLEGDMRASLNDWIIRGVKGEIYPCKPDIFQATYEPIEDTSEEAQRAYVAHQSFLQRHGIKP